MFHKMYIYQTYYTAKTTKLSVEEYSKLWNKFVNPLLEYCIRIQKKTKGIMEKYEQEELWKACHGSQWLWVIIVSLKTARNIYYQ